MKRGRKSTAELQVGALVSIVERRPEPPPDLPDAAAGIWRQVAGTKPGGWFGPDTFPILRAYCLHVVQAQLIDAQIAVMQPEWLSTDDGLARMDQLLRMRDRETRALVMLGRSMRLTQHSQVHKETAARAHRDTVTGPKPWDDV